MFRSCTFTKTQVSIEGKQENGTKQLDVNSEIFFLSKWHSGNWDPISSLMKRDLRNTDIKNKTDPENPG